MSAATYLLESGGDRSSWRTVAVAQSIHAMIKANDALTVRFLGQRSSRHEDAAALLKTLVVRRLIPERHASRRRALAEALREKSEFDYGGAGVSREEAERRIHRAEKFLRDVRGILTGSHAPPNP